MKLIKSTDSTKVRLVKQLSLGAVCGASLGFLVGCFGTSLSKMDFSQLSLSEHLGVVTLILGTLALIVTVYFLIDVNRLYQRYQSLDEGDEVIYRRLEKHHAYALIFSGLSLAFAFINIVLVYKVMVKPNGADLIIPIFGFAVLTLGCLFQMLTIKWHNKIRGTKSPLVPTLKELKNNVMHLDEAELQANYKISYEIVMNLSGLILPALYIFLFFQTMLLQEVNVTAIFIVGIIQIYILLMQFKMVKNFYK